MAFTKGLNNPVWYPANILPGINGGLPIITAAGAATTSAESGDDKYVYHINLNGFWRVNSHSDSSERLPYPRVAISGGATMSYTKRRGYHGIVLGATSTTIQISSPPNPKQLDGETISLEKGTAKGQSRTLTFVSETIHDFGLLTATTTSSITDSTKKWEVNQWAGYSMTITLGSGSTETKKILYNDTTTLYFYDASLIPQQPWMSYPFTATYPYSPIPVVTAGSQAHFEIKSSTYSVTAWDVTPTKNTFFTTLTGGIFLLTSQAAAPFINLQYYDIVGQEWIGKTIQQGLISAVGTDWSIERCSKQTPLISGTCTSGGVRFITDIGLSLPLFRYKNYRIEVRKGNEYCSRRIEATNGNTIFVIKDFDFTPDATTTYEVHHDYNKLFIALGGSSSLFAYNTEYDMAHGGEYFDNGIACQILATPIGGGWQGFGITSGTRIALGVQAVNSAPTAGGTGYLVGDILTCSVGGTGSQVVVTSISPGGIVTGVKLYHTGTATGFTVGTGKATTGGTGTGCTINITTVGPTALITANTNHIFNEGMIVKFDGCSDVNWNANHTILCTPTLTTFCVIPTAAANMATTVPAQSTTQISDGSANWIVNEHAGKLVSLSGSGYGPTSQIRWIVSNTATTLTTQGTITAGVNGTSKYVIYDSMVYGVDNQYKQEYKWGFGFATGGSTTTLVDSSKNWNVNQWAGYKFTVETGTGVGSGIITVISNTATTLTYAIQTFTPDSTTNYVIQDTWGLLTASTTILQTETGTKNFIVNQFSGKRFRFTGGTGLGQEVVITSNTNNAITNATATAGSTDTTYAILGKVVTGTGIEINHNWGVSDALTKGKYIIVPQGGGRYQIDIFDITTSRFLIGKNYGAGDLVNTGSYWAYDGGDYIYFTPQGVAGASPRLNRINLVTGVSEPAGQITPLIEGTLAIGNRMEIINAGGKKIIYIEGNGTTLAVKGDLTSYLY